MEVLIAALIPLLIPSRAPNGYHTRKCTVCVTFICDLKLSAFITPRVERKGDLFDAVIHARVQLGATKRLIMKVHFDEEVEAEGGSEQFIKLQLLLYIIRGTRESVQLSINSHI